MRRLVATLVILPLGIGSALSTVNINSAQQSELERTKGLDKLKAKAIIEHRAQNGAFTTVEQLEKIPGFDHELVLRMKPQLSIAGDAYVPEPRADKAKDKVKKVP